MRKIGHHPGPAGTVEGWWFRRCRCGFVLALSTSGRVWWVRAHSPVLEIRAPELLFAALATECRYYRARAPVTPGNPALAESRAPTSAALLKAAAASEARATKPLASKPAVMVKPRSGVVSTRNR